MGKTKQFMSSLRSRLSPSNSYPKYSPPSTATPSPRPRFSPFHWKHNDSTPTVCTDDSSLSEAGTPPTTPSKSPRGSLLGKTIAGAVKSVEEPQDDVLIAENDLRTVQWYRSARARVETDIAMVDFGKGSPRQEPMRASQTAPRKKTTQATQIFDIAKEKEETVKENYPHAKRRYLGAHAAMETNMAMLDFAKRLPLEELSMIGEAYVNSPRREDNRAEAKPRYEYGKPGPKQRSHNCSGSSWSFACRSARRAERENNEQDADDDASSFGSLDGWGVTAKDTAVYQKDTLTSSLSDPSPPRFTTICNMGPVVCAQAPPVTSPKRPRPYSMTASILSQWSADSFESFIQYLTVEPQKKTGESEYPAMSDEEFNAIPDWSDVEDDPMYNIFLHTDPFQWSDTESSCSFLIVDEATPAGSAVHAATDDMGYRAARSVETPALRWTCRGQKRKQGNSCGEPRVAKRAKGDHWMAAHIGFPTGAASTVNLNAYHRRCIAHARC